MRQLETVRQKCTTSNPGLKAEALKILAICYYLTKFAGVPRIHKFQLHKSMYFQTNSYTYKRVHFAWYLDCC